MIPRLLGEIHDKDTQFSAALKNNQEAVLIGGSIFVIAIIAFFILTSESAPKGSWRYGVCKTFLEQYAQYPPNLRILTAGEKQNSAQIGYLITNSYGSQESELMECFYNIDQNGVTLNRVSIDRHTYDADKVKEFSASIPIILADENLDLTLPPRLANTLEGLKYE